MKHSIRTRITLSLTFTIVLTLLITWCINRTFLPYYYIHSKINSLNEAYDKITQVVVKSEDPLIISDSEQQKIEKLEREYDVNTYIFSSINMFVQHLNKYNKISVAIYPTNDLRPREEEKINEIFGEYLGFTSKNYEGKKILLEKNNYYINKIHDRELDSDFIDLFGIVEGAAKDAKESDQTLNGLVKDRLDNKFILIRSNVESIDEGVAIANEFLAYVGVLAVILGSLAMFILSKRFTNPIMELAGIAKKMTELNFEVKYVTKSQDEIGELGSSINTLSDRLETTITELKQANNELMTDIQRKIEIDEMRKEFLSNVSHELKTPISLVQGYAEGLKENINDDAESRDFYCEVIIDEANKMNQMVKKLLSLNEIEFGNNQVNFERFDLVALIQSVVDSSDILLKQKEVTLYFEHEEPVYVWADEFLIQQVVNNYISNALNHVKGQRIIEIKLIPREETLRVAVFNTGDNIPEEELDKIWIKFYKVDKARTREYGGSGIGLSIVKAVMNSHNKEFGVINRAVGVEFWFELDIKS